jgi:hypothetical protein
MKIKVIEESRERCAEAGWYAYDYETEHKIDKNFILSLRPLGSFTYMPMLKKPFFKIESEHYIIKGIEADNFFRVAVHGDHVNEMDMITSFIERIPK